MDVDHSILSNYLLFVKDNIRYGIMYVSDRQVTIKYCIALKDIELIGGILIRAGSIWEFVSFDISSGIMRMRTAKKYHIEQTERWIQIC